MTTVRYHPAAEEELLNEIGFLELRAAGLGRRFFGEIQRAERLVAQFPESGYELSSGIREVSSAQVSLLADLLHGKGRLAHIGSGPPSTPAWVLGPSP